MQAIVVDGAFRGTGAEVIREKERREENEPSSYCPACSQRLEPRRCKLLCPVCGYYMSCSDYY